MLSGKVSKSLVKRLAFFVIYYFVVIAVKGELFDIAVTLPIFVLVIIGVSQIKAGYFSFADMYWILVLLFFVTAPVMVINDGCFEYGTLQGYCYREGDVWLVSTFLTIALSIIFIVLKKFLIFDFKALYNVSAISRRFVKFCLYSPLLAFFIYLLVIGPDALLASRADKSDMGISPLFILAYSFFIFSIFMLIYINRVVGVKISKLYMLACVFLMLLACNPFNMPRFFFVATWLPVLFLFFRFKVNFYFVYFGITVALILLMPVMSLTTRLGIEGLNEFNLIYAVGKSFEMPYIDVFDMFVYMVEYVDLYGHGDGAFILLFLFFIPRSVWSGKPELYSIDIGENLLYLKISGTENLSMSFIADFYYDFGYVGGLVVLTFTCWGLSALASKLSKLKLSSVLLLCLMGTLPIIMRGPFPAVAGLFFCLSISCIIYTWLMNLMCKR